MLRGKGRQGMLEMRCPETFQHARCVLGYEALEDLEDLERRITLQAIDECWAEHLATASEVRDSIHLARIGQLSPLNEFIKHAAAAFLALVITENGVNLEAEKLRGPSSTWTPGRL